MKPERLGLYQQERCRKKKQSRKKRTQSSEGGRPTARSISAEKTRQKEDARPAGKHKG